MFQNVETEEEHVDDRSVEDLLSFINGGNGGIHACLSTVCCMIVHGFILSLLTIYVEFC